MKDLYQIAYDTVRPVKLKKTEGPAIDHDREMTLKEVLPEWWDRKWD